MGQRRRRAFRLAKAGMQIGRGRHCAVRVGSAGTARQHLKQATQFGSALDTHLWRSPGYERRGLLSSGGVPIRGESSLLAQCRLDGNEDVACLVGDPCHCDES